MNIFKYLNISTITIFYTCNCFSLKAQETCSREYQIKAAFLFNFTQYVQWPTESFPNPQSPFIIGIVGEDPFGYYLDKIVQGEKVDGHSVEIYRFSNNFIHKPCHILFINLDKANQVEEILNYLKNQNTLTVSDKNHFAHRGGMMRFYTDNNKMRIRINPEAAKAANLIISSKLLRLADIVPTKSN